MNRYDVDISNDSPYGISVSFEALFLGKVERDFWICNNSGNFFDVECVDPKTIKLTTRHLSRSVILNRETWAALMESFAGVALLWDECKPLHIFIENSVLKRNNEENFANLWYFYEYIMRDTSICSVVFNRAISTSRGTSQTAIDISLLGGVLLQDAEIRSRLQEDMLNESKHVTNLDLMNFNNSLDVAFLRPRASTNVSRVIGQIDLFDMIVRYSVSTPIQQMSHIDFTKWLKYQKTTDELKGWLGW